jgi:hypothetical protein
MKGVLVRIGIDSTDGCWNAPVRKASREFAYVTITETKPLRRGLARRFGELVPAVARFGWQLPLSLLRQPTHLDPDFERLTYGDQGQRARSILKLQRGDLLAFFAGLRSVDDPDGSLVYAIIGLYVIEQIVSARSVPRSRWHENAHTRRIPGPGDIVVRARRGVSGRLTKCLPIGGYRNRAYRVRRDLLKAWGGLEVRDGYIQRSARLPAFRDASRFYRWFRRQKPQLIAANNP